MLGLALVLVAAAAVLLVVNVFMPHHDLVVLTLKDFRDLPTVTAVTAKPPSLYITIDAAAWASLSPDRRERLVREIGSRAQRVHYNGAVLQTPERRIVGQWFANGKVTVQPDITGTPS